MTKNFGVRNDEVRKEEDDFIFEAEKPVRRDDDIDENAGGKMTWEETDRQWDDEYWEEDFADENEKFQVVSDPDDAITKADLQELAQQSTPDDEE